MKLTLCSPHVNPVDLKPELGMSTEIEYSGKYEYPNFFASKYG